MNQGRESNLRLEREVNARFAYDVRNKGALAAVDAMHERNARRRQEDKKAAYERVREDLHKRAEAALREMKRVNFSQITD